ncbi:MAG TPA: hypothetical protein VFP63_05520 [Dehalococcoidia bacterium]|nr:hypothetical protein [Dehalococcoidia bacterium]
MGAAAACGDDSDAGDTQSPTISGTPDLSPRSGGVAAAQRYLQGTGIDGDKGDFTDPVACAEITDDTDGDFCIHEGFSIYAGGLVILRVADRDNPDEDVWEMRLTPAAGGWQVNSVEPFGEN